MLTIHHATAKKATASEIALCVSEDGESIVATWNKHVIAGDNASQVLAVMIIAKPFLAEYAGIEISIENDTVTIECEGCESAAARVDSFDVLMAEFLDANSEALQAEASDTEDDEDTSDRKVVVAKKYKDEYKARGNPKNCGDWLAQVLEDHCNTKDGFHADTFKALLVANNVPMVGKWAGLPTSGQKGWVGRWRMNGRQKLERQIATEGKMFDEQGSPINVDQDWLMATLNKYPSLDTKVA